MGWKMKKEQECNDVRPAVFIHSSFRTGSTWLWSKFRENQGCYCYYEIFNEILAGINFKNILQSAADWNSHHPRGAPYFAEFSPLLDKADGIAGFDLEMAFDDFFLNSESDIDRIRRAEAYLASLVNLAQHNHKTPVLSCTRSIGRAKLIRESIGGTHILIRRSLLNQWFSYSHQKLNGNNYFVNSIIHTVKAEDGDTFILTLLDILEDNQISEDKFGEDDDTILIVFLCLHIYLYAKHRDDFDVSIDFRNGSSRSDLDAATRLLTEVTQLRVDLSDYRETISAPNMLIRDADRVFSIVRSLFAKPISGIDEAKLRALVDEELADFEQGYEEYCRIAGSAHAQLEAYAVERSRLERSGDVAVEELRTRLEVATGELAAATSAFRKAELAMQQDRALLDEKITVFAKRMNELGALAQRDTNDAGSEAGQRPAGGVGN